jgi:hypothetical protein
MIQLTMSGVLDSDAAGLQGGAAVCGAFMTALFGMVDPSVS